jgi:hypothetical protein
MTSGTGDDALFTNTTLFASRQTSLLNVNATGKYYIDTAAGTVKVWVSGPSAAPASPGKITYFYDSPSFSDNGLYSVDYKNGKIYVQRSMGIGWTLQVTYDHIDLRAEYRIARLLDPRGYDIDIVNQTVTFKDSEILKYFNIPHGSISSRAPTYLVNYDYVGETRESVEELKDSFSPTIKDYALRVLTKGKIF